VELCTSVGTTAKLHSLTFIKVYHLHTSVGTTAKLHSLTFIKVYHLHTSVRTTAKLHSLTFIKGRWYTFINVKLWSFAVVLTLV
jgi:hypothetical protein